jgi:hypothetical protein
LERAGQYDILLCVEAPAGVCVAVHCRCFFSFSLVPADHRDAPPAFSESPDAIPPSPQVSRDLPMLRALLGPGLASVSSVGLEFRYQGGGIFLHSEVAANVPPCSSAILSTTIPLASCISSSLCMITLRLCLSAGSLPPFRQKNHSNIFGVALESFGGHIRDIRGLSVVQERNHTFGQVTSHVFVPKGNLSMPSAL